MSDVNKIIKTNPLLRHALTSTNTLRKPHEHKRTVNFRTKNSKYKDIFIFGEEYK